MCNFMHYIKTRASNNQKELKNELDLNELLVYMIHLFIILFSNFSFSETLHPKSYFTDKTHCLSSHRQRLIKKIYPCSTDTASIEILKSMLASPACLRVLYLSTIAIYHPADKSIRKTSS